MNATCAKQSFIFKTISEVVSFLITVLQVKHDAAKTYKSGYHKHHDCIKTLNPSAKKWTVSNLTSNFVLLGYQVSINEIFVKRLTN